MIVQLRDEDGRLFWQGRYRRNAHLTVGVCAEPLTHLRLAEAMHLHTSAAVGREMGLSWQGIADRVGISNKTLWLKRRAYQIDTHLPPRHV